MQTLTRAGLTLNALEKGAGPCTGMRPRRDFIFPFLEIAELPMEISDILEADQRNMLICARNNTWVYGCSLLNHFGDGHT